MSTATQPHGLAKNQDSGSDAERDLWTQFLGAEAAEDFCRPWLALQCRRMAGVSGGLVLLGPVDTGPYVPVAIWTPLQRSLEHLAPTAERALVERRGIVAADPHNPTAEPEQRRHYLAYPLEIAGHLHGVVVIEARSRSEGELQALLRELHWGAGWLEVLFRRRSNRDDVQFKQRLCTVLDLVARVLEETRFQGAATALVTEIAGQLSCDRVSLGWQRGSYIRIQALSHSAAFGKDMNLIRSLEATMDEALEAQHSVVFPVPDDSIIQHAHEELASTHQAAAILTLPILINHQPRGAITLERWDPTPFTRGELDLGESITALVGPILDLQRQNERWLITRAGLWIRTQLQKLTGPRHWVLKSSFIGVFALVVFFALATADYRIAAKVTLEGAVQRALVAPFDGYIDQAPARAGDIVQAEQLLCTLDDEDLSLERLKWATQREQYLGERREAAANRERARSRILAAQIRQADAQLALLDQQLKRTRIVAPFTGIVVSGDLSQSLGSPVRRGDLLFEVAPLDHYRVVLHVDEWDIGQVNTEQSGRLTLSALPQEPLNFVVTQITPVAAVDEGQSVFRVEAQLTETSPRLRPGMAGVGKIHVGERRLIWIWTHKLVDWLRLKLWTWWS